MAIAWTKRWSAADAGTIIGGNHLGTIQDDVDAGFEQALSDALSVALPSQVGHAGEYLTTNGTDASWSDIFDLIYPVGIVVTLGVSTNPATLFGVGTWTAITGRVIVGIDAGQTEFDTLDETGGAKTVNASHTHTNGITQQTGSQPQEAWRWISNYSAGGGDYSQVSTTTTGSGGSSTQSTLQPYIVKYVWQRTA
jgi:hypothetical protein